MTKIKFTPQMAEDSRKSADLHGMLMSLLNFDNIDDIFAIDNVLIKLTEKGKGMSLLEDYSMLTANQQEIMKIVVEKYQQLNKAI